jgi:predicted metal-dependent peptidase
MMPSPGEEPEDYGWDDAGVASRRHEPRAPQLPSPSARTDPGAADALVQRWQSRLASAAQAAMQAGHLSASLARSLDHLIQPRVPWRALLARFLMSVARDDYGFQRGSRRDGDALLPRLASGEINVVVALDTSGSIGDAEMRDFASEVDALKGHVRANLVLHACDHELSPDGPWYFAPWDPVILPKTLSGGGGTRFTPVFEWVERGPVQPDLLLYFTDAQGEFPAAAPPYPVIWLVKGRAPVPWGERIQLN